MLLLLLLFIYLLLKQNSQKATYIAVWLHTKALQCGYIEILFSMLSRIFERFAVY